MSLVTFEQLLAKIKTVSCEEVRAMGDEYCEVVVSKANMQGMTNVLLEYFGQPLKPEGKETGKEAGAIAKPYGGVYESQTLYFRKNESDSVVALLWPWSGGNPVTIKVILRK